jgi:hypothetical protein
MLLADSTTVAPKDVRSMARDGMLSLASDVRQVENESVCFGVTGLMNSGKSTLVHALLGVDVSPARTTAMTVLPTRFVHDVSCETPVLELPAEKLNELVSAIRALLHEFVQTPLTSIADMRKWQAALFDDYSGSDDDGGDDDNEENLKQVRELQQRQLLSKW